MDGKNYWNNCPPEIISQILNKLDATDIISCLYVNRLWRRIIENDIQVDWQKIAEYGLYDGGVEMKTKLNLDWRGVVIKRGEWVHGMQFVKVNILHVYNGQRDYLPSMTVYKDKLYVCSRKHTACINIKKCESTQLENTHDLKGMHFVDESDHIRVFSDGRFKLRLLGKSSADDEVPPTAKSSTEFKSEYHILYLLVQDRCYIFSKMKYLRSFIWSNQEWQPKFIARFNGSLEFVAMATRGNRVYFMAKYGDLWMTSEDDRAFKKLASFPSPDFYHPANSYAVLKTILSVSSEDSYGSVSEQLGLLFLKSVTCATFHAGVLLLAFSDGNVQALIMKTEKSEDYILRYEEFDSDSSCNAESGLSRLEEYEKNEYIDLSWLWLGQKHYEYRLTYRCYDLCRVHDFVYGMAVHEGESSRHLLINCGHTIYQYLLTYPRFS